MISTEPADDPTTICDTCGHARGYHGESWCIAGICDCTKFVLRALVDGQLAPDTDPEIERLRAEVSAYKATLRQADSRIDELSAEIAVLRKRWDRLQELRLRAAAVSGPATPGPTREQVGDVREVVAAALAKVRGAGDQVAYRMFLAELAEQGYEVALFGRSAPEPATTEDEP